MRRVAMRDRLFVSIFAAVLCMTAGSTSAQGAVEVNRESGEAYTAGVRHYSAGRYSAADSLFHRAIELDSRNTAAVFALGLSLNKQRKFDQAAVQFRRVIDADPGHSKAWQALPLALRDSGDIDGAIASYDLAIARFPGDSVFPLGKAQLLMRQGDFTNAAAVLAKAAESDPDNPSVQQALGYAHLQSGKPDAALESYRKALDLSPADIELRYMVAQVLVQLERGGEAARAAEEVLAIDPNHGRAHIIIADYLRSGGKLEEALDHYRAAATNLATKPYADHYIEVIEQQLEEEEIEREWEARQGE